MSEIYHKLLRAQNAQWRQRYVNFKLLESQLPAAPSTTPSLGEQYGTAHNSADDLEAAAVSTPLSPGRSAQFELTFTQQLSALRAIHRQRCAAATMLALHGGRAPCVSSVSLGAKGGVALCDSRHLCCSKFCGSIVLGS